MIAKITVQNKGLAEAEFLLSPVEAGQYPHTTQISQAEGRWAIRYAWPESATAADHSQLVGTIASLASLLKFNTVSIQGEGQSAGELGTQFEIAAWNDRLYKGTRDQEDKRPELTVICADGKTKKAFENGQLLGRAINFSRSLSLTPPNIANPEWMAEQAKIMAAATGLKCTVIKGKELEKEKLEGLINVGKASENSPCLVRLEYRPKGASAKPVVLLGKTITYDTGGLSIKPREGMVGMKQDKDGGCAVLGAMQAIATYTRPDRPVIGLLVAAENSISDEAYRPDDVLTFRNGVTVEVTNTDAEGRLVLADGLCWACDKEDPACIVDIATLTGGVVTALGAVFAGAFSNDEDLYSKLTAASAKTGERIWRLPLDAEYRKMMKSPVADIINSNANRQAHPVQGATFLEHFVADGMAWAHLDIAGVHHYRKATGAFIEGPSGWGVRLLSELAAAF